MHIRGYARDARSRVHLPQLSTVQSPQIHDASAVNERRGLTTHPPRVSVGGFLSGAGRQSFVLLEKMSVSYVNCQSRCVEVGSAEADALGCAVTHCLHVSADGGRSAKTSRSSRKASSANATHPDHANIL
jgi:hypothetical protein